jgi:hypothetical protein
VSTFRAEVMSWDSRETIYIGLQEAKSEGTSQLGQGRQRLSQTNEETPRRHQMKGGYVRAVWGV